jgi:hypothetical protein
MRVGEVYATESFKAKWDGGSATFEPDSPDTSMMLMYMGSQPHDGSQNISPGQILVDLGWVPQQAVVPMDQFKPVAEWSSEVHGALVAMKESGKLDKKLLSNLLTAFDEKLSPIFKSEQDAEAE